MRRGRGEPWDACGFVPAPVSQKAAHRPDG
ncbi:hypothetical protein OH687_00925 [Burkholderia anthina]|nr:hypothetical protein OH687_00925 [Burkholderia anthina]